MATKKIHIVLRFLLIFLLVFIQFFPAIDAGFVTDFTGLYPRLAEGTIIDAFKSFGFPSLMPVLNLCLFFLFKVFGLSGLAWFVFSLFFFCLALVGFSIFLEKLLADYNFVNVQWISYAAILMVVFHPSSVEALVWKVGLGHVLSVCFFMWALVFARSTRKQASLWMSLCLVFSLLSFEWALVFPFMLLVFALYERRFLFYKRSILWSVVIILLYLITTKLCIGSWIGHYGVEGSDFKPFRQVATGIKHWLKNVFFIPFYPFTWKQIIYSFISSYWTVGLFSLFVTTGGWFAYQTSKSRTRCLFVFFVCSMLGIVLVSQLHFMTSISENDRYTSLMLPFLMGFLSLLFFGLGKKLGLMIAVVYIVCCGFFQKHLIKHWADNQTVLELLVDTYPCEGQQTLVLNAPENFRYTFMLRDYNFENPLIDHFAMYQKDLKSSVLVAQSNLSLRTDKLQATLIEDSVIKVSFEQWGNWWIRKGKGATNYSSEYFSVTFKGKYYMLTLKENHPFECIIYADNDGWHLVE